MIRGVKMLAAFLGRSPDTATAEEVRSFQRHLATTGITPGVQNMAVSGLRFFFRFTVDKPETTRHLVYTYEPQKLANTSRASITQAGVTRAWATSARQPSRRRTGHGHWKSNSLSTESGEVQSAPCARIAARRSGA